jgi:hypothetical protein
MALHLEIRRIGMTAHEAVYEFGPSKGPVGRFTINRGSGNVELNEPIPGEIGEAHFARASHKIHKCWQDGKLPEKTCWAS